MLDSWLTQKRKNKQFAFESRRTAFFGGFANSWLADDVMIGRRFADSTPLLHYPTFLYICVSYITRSPINSLFMAINSKHELCNYILITWMYHHRPEITNRGWRNETAEFPKAFFPWKIEHLTNEWAENTLNKNVKFPCRFVISERFTSPEMISLKSFVLSSPLLPSRWPDTNDNDDDDNLKLVNCRSLFCFRLHPARFCIDWKKLKRIYWLLTLDVEGKQKTMFLDITDIIIVVSVALELLFHWLLMQTHGEQVSRSKQIRNGLNRTETKVSFSKIIHQSVDAAFNTWSRNFLKSWSNNNDETFTASPDRLTLYAHWIISRGLHVYSHNTHRQPLFNAAKWNFILRCLARQMHNLQAQIYKFHYNWSGAGRLGLARVQRNGAELNSTSLSNLSQVEIAPRYCWMHKHFIQTLNCLFDDSEQTLSLP